MSCLLYWLSGFLPARMINGEDGEKYLERYFIARLFGCEIYLHRFVDSDPDRGFHNHPWRWAASLVLSGSYIERIWSPVRCAKGRLRKAGTFTWFDADHLHRVVSTGQECWTLFIVGPRTEDSEWGFFTQAPLSMGTKWTYQPYTGSPSPDWCKTAPTGNALRAQA